MKLVMMGTGTFAEPTFEALLAGPHTVVGLFTQPDRSGGHERGSTRQTGKGMKNIALEHGIPVYQPESVNTPPGVADLQALQADLLVVAAYGQILSKDVLGTTKHGGINVHASLLPKYRGAAPIAWAIYHGEKQTGVTIIQMSVKLDAGGMIAQEAVDIGPDETAGELEARLAPLGARMAVQVLEQIGAGTAKPHAAGSGPGDEGAEAEEGRRVDRLDPNSGASVLPDQGDAAVADGVYVPASPEFVAPATDCMQCPSLSGH